MNLLKAFIVVLPLCCANVNAEIDEAKLGTSIGYPTCNAFPYADSCKVGSFSNPSGFKHSVVNPSTKIIPIEKSDKAPLSKLGGSIGIDIDRYLSKQRATGLMIIHDGKVIVEKYQYSRNSESPLRSFSMAKTITSLLVGIAIEKGHIESIDDRAEKYLPEIQGTVYGEATIKNLLRMSVGTNFKEEYKFGKSDVTTFYENMYYKNLKSNALEFNKRTFDQGKKFQYSTSDTVVLSRVLASATKKTITELTQDWLWDPIGAENKAYWILLRSDNLEDCGGGFFATLKDYGKIGILLANDGFMNGVQIVPKQYLLDATDSNLQPSGFKKNQAAYNYFGYGYHVWLLPFKERSFSLQGIYGQNIFVQPSSKVVMVQTSVYEKPSADPSWDMQIDLFKAAIKEFGGNPY